jgi:nitrate/nitrite transporter NarK
MASPPPRETMRTGLSPQPPWLRLYCRLPMTSNPLAFLASSSPRQRRALAASTLGWMLDGMDVTLYAMVLRELLRELQLTTAQAGLLASVTLIASAAGGILFGLFADRFGRRIALIATAILTTL